jgi:hypothetical protein
MNNVGRRRNLRSIEQKPGAAIVGVIDESCNAERAAFKVDIECGAQVVAGIPTGYDYETKREQNL